MGWKGEFFFIILEEFFIRMDILQNRILYPWLQVSPPKSWLPGSLKMRLTLLGWLGVGAAKNALFVSLLKINLSEPLWLWGLWWCYWKEHFQLVLVEPPALYGGAFVIMCASNKACAVDAWTRYSAHKKLFNQLKKKMWYRVNDEVEHYTSMFLV